MGRLLTLLLVDVELVAQLLDAQDQAVQIVHKILAQEVSVVRLLAKRVLATKIHIILMEAMDMKKKKGLMDNIEMKAMVDMEVKDTHPKETTDIFHKIEKKKILEVTKELEKGMVQMLMEIMGIQQGMEVHMTQMEHVPLDNVLQMDHALQVDHTLLTDHVHLVNVLQMVQVLRIGHVGLVNAIQVVVVQTDMETMVMGMGTTLVVDTEVAQEMEMAMEAMGVQLIVIVFLQP